MIITKNFFLDELHKNLQALNIKIDTILYPPAKLTQGMDNCYQFIIEECNAINIKKLAEKIASKGTRISFINLIIPTSVEVSYLLINSEYNVSARYLKDFSIVYEKSLERWDVLIKVID